jgi:hypothetical protein
LIEVVLQLGCYHFLSADITVDQGDFFLTQVVNIGQGLV